VKGLPLIDINVRKQALSWVSWLFMNQEQGCIQKMWLGGQNVEDNCVLTFHGGQSPPSPQMQPWRMVHRALLPC